jgi:hypothetical protein
MGELVEVEFQRFWRRLQQLGLNAYESRSYLVLLGHPKFKALELAARAHVPRQKIYEVLDSLVEKDFAQVVQEKTKLFSAVEPSLAVPSFLSRKRQAMEQELTDQSRAASAVIDDLSAAYSEGREGGEHSTFCESSPNRADRRGVSPNALGSDIGVRGIFTPALRGGSARRATGPAGARSWSVVPAVDRIGHVRGSSSPKSGGLFGRGRGSAAGGETADEAGGVRWPAAE